MQSIPMEAPEPTGATAVHYDLIRIIRTLRVHAGHGALAAGSASALFSVVYHGPLRTTDLAEREGVAAPTMSRIVAALERQGLITRMADPDDGRASLLVPTEDGRSYICGATSRKSQLMAAALERLDEEQRTELERSIGLLADSLAAAAEEAAGAERNVNENEERV
ncbi:MarR family transcriptional regulator [Tsukamurella sp. 8F]|uniref:MarR family winged helix-turn-helix transcriptional regulator n=1 Tax=unclassified Tsukamurella TaxID=2633480 RepID=UPI0023B9182D|nr:MULTISPECIES: MarR family transcriptional regulator [unclassified Tsukamurella]MDF0531854.1 MarR family transcriptional regulator [Tsukamurella sp. 8J]MDF0589068.1 MarR family transcriptional regulator [Tsukamurella sp. 8F]